MRRLPHPPHLLGECPRWDAEHGRALLVDVLGGVVRHGDVEDLAVTTVDGHVGCVAPVATDATRLVAGIDDGIALVDLADGALEWLARPEAARRGEVRMNDGAVDPQGRLVVGSMAYDTAAGAGRLYRVDGTGRVEVLLEGCTIPNGLVWTEDGTTLLHVDSGTSTLTAYLYPVEGPLPPGRVLARWDDAGSVPDGLCRDDGGNLWLAFWGAGAVRVLSPAGVLLDEVSVPATQSSACALLGDRGQLLVTSARDGLREPGPDDGRSFVLSANARASRSWSFAAT